ncbi:MAG: hypothetical protein CMN72_07870 [Sphingomonas sp.]|nr:hypothetical protein [Sphingomonas sp.]
MSEHRCFTVSETSYLRALDDEDRRADCVAVHYQKPPRINDDGRTTFSLNFPLLIVSAYAANSREVAERVAAILNKHWDDEPSEGGES